MRRVEAHYQTHRLFLWLRTDEIDGETGGEDVVIVLRLHHTRTRLELAFHIAPVQIVGDGLKQSELLKM